MEKTDWHRLLKERDFNVRVSKLDDVRYASISEKMAAYIQLVRDSLGEEIVTSKKTYIGNYVLVNGPGKIQIGEFQCQGTALVANLSPKIRKSCAIRINVRMKQGMKSWIISQ